jgi:hypothetical protein
MVDYGSKEFYEQMYVKCKDHSTAVTKVLQAASSK